MNLSQINTATLRQILKLSEKKELLLNEANKIDVAIEGLCKGHTKTTSSPVSKSPSSPSQPKVKKQKRSPKKMQRGMVKENVLKALKEAGPIGMKVNELSKKLGIKSANLHVWFSNVGKKIQGIERIAPGHFRLHHKQEEMQSSIQLPQSTQELIGLKENA